MPPLADRQRYEDQIVADLEPIFSAQYRVAVASPRDIPYAEFQRRLRGTMQAELAQVFRSAGGVMFNQLGIVASAGAFGGTAQTWASAAADELASGVVQTSRKLASEAVSKAGDDPQKLREALALVFLSDSRLQSIAITEVTKAVSAGEHAVVIPFNQGLFSRRTGGRRGEGGEEGHHFTEEQKERQEQEEAYLQGRQSRVKGRPRTARVYREEDAELIPIWRIDPRSNVCEHCLPLDGHSRDYWGHFFPMGPPAHPRCACHIQWLEAAEFAQMQRAA